MWRRCFQFSYDAAVFVGSNIHVGSFLKPETTTRHAGTNTPVLKLGNELILIRRNRRRFPVGDRSGSDGRTGATLTPRWLPWTESLPGGAQFPLPGIKSMTTRVTWEKPTPQEDFFKSFSRRRRKRASARVYYHLNRGKDPDHPCCNPEGSEERKSADSYPISL